MRVDHGMTSLEHVEVTSQRLSRLHVDGANTLRTINIKSTRLQVGQLHTKFQRRHEDHGAR